MIGIDDLPDPIRSKVLAMDGPERDRFCRTWLPVVPAAGDDVPHVVGVEMRSYFQLLEIYRALLAAVCELVEFLKGSLAMPREVADAGTVDSESYFRLMDDYTTLLGAYTALLKSGGR